MSRMQEIYNSDLSPKAISVYQYLMIRGNRKRECFPKHKTIAADLKLSVSTVKRALDELCAGGYIQKERRQRPDGGYTSNNYKLI